MTRAKENLGQPVVVATVRRRWRVKTVSLAGAGWAVGVACTLAAHALGLAI